MFTLYIWENKNKLWHFGVPNTKLVMLGIELGAQMHLCQLLWQSLCGEFWMLKSANRPNCALYKHPISPARNDWWQES